MKKFLTGLLLGLILGAIGYSYFGPHLRRDMASATVVAGETIEDVGREVKSKGKAIRR